MYAAPMLPPAAALGAALRLAAESHGTLTALTVQHHLLRYGATIGVVDGERDVETAEARRLANEIDAAAAEYHIALQTRQPTAPRP